ncbi:hypothetical protein Aple_072940 [Acrocarpospora pleiomorpha]|uniref:Uncharacterized protein n=1 Tax=Acrocarpospora pleiomorpha TaxID=90975 RepID=A0A5M3XT41_9ACTN|nr:hypothetical protein [Acrocarpospora pleiomorpha]GES24395.1 hypothetical protein Aple_072940 [Acrocarpospora pleiomorpha]
MRTSLFWVRIDGAIRDLTSSEVTVVNTCARAVFRFTHSPSYSSYEHISTCTFLTPKKVALRKQYVRQVEMLICAEPLTTKLRCLADGTWQTLYIAG